MRTRPGRLRRTIDCVRTFARVIRALTQSPFFLQREIQALREAAEGQGGATKRRILFGQSVQFLATTRTVICHTKSPF